MENALGLTPGTFIPPFDTYDENTVLALKACGFKVVSGESWFTEHYYGKTRPFVTPRGVTHAPELCGFVENWQSGSFHSLNYLKGRFENAYAENRTYIQMIHYFTFTTEEKINRLKAFIRFVKSHERVKFMTLEEFGESFPEGEATRKFRAGNPISVQNSNGHPSTVALFPATSLTTAFFLKSEDGDRQF